VYGQYRPTIILTQVDTALHPSGGSKAYSQYIKHLEKTSPEIIAQETRGTLENFTLGWGDYLQAPLQVRLFDIYLNLSQLKKTKPLQDNLASATYETFEQCPIKYRRYEEVCCILPGNR
jgi:protein arginine N-methyltransferase 5